VSAETRIIPATPSAIAEAAALIQAGELVAFPTETVYGLGADALNADAVAKIFVAKQRPANDPLIVHIAAVDQLELISPSVPALALVLIEAFWPGPLTLVLPRHAHLPPMLSAGLPSVAVRMPAHPVAKALIEAAGTPIAAPSANLFSYTSPTTAQHVWEDLRGRIPLILDGGPTPVGVESSVLDLSGPRPRLLRPGGVSLEAIARFATDVDVVRRYVDPGEGADAEAVASPGMLLRHYSPRAKVYLVEGPETAVQAALAADARDLRKSGKLVGLLIAEEDRGPLERAGVIDYAPVIALGPLDDIEHVARTLYAGLRALDSLGVDVILARAFPAQGIGLAVHDRLLRAAEGRVRRV
jgi:L-threonylcarbamoyladenylate synthase